jgi:hypothetical protein
MQTKYSAILVLQGGYSIHDIVRNLPTDPPSIFVLVLVAAAVGWIVWASWRKGKPS